jgi:hypothetical protein
MDLSSVFQDPRARMKEAEALAILMASAAPAQRMLDGAKREFGQVLPVSEMGVFISPTAEENYKHGKREATRLLFDGYAAILFPGVPDAEGFIAALEEIEVQVKNKLGVIDGDEAALCRLAWEKRAWERAQPPWLGRVWRNLRDFFKKKTPSSKVVHDPAEEPGKRQNAIEEDSESGQMPGTELHGSTREARAQSLQANEVERGRSPEQSDGDCRSVPTVQPSPPDTILETGGEVASALSDFDSLNRVSPDDPAYGIWKDFYVALHKTDAQFVSHHARRARERKPLDLNEFLLHAVDLF